MLLVALELLLSVSSLPALLSPLRSERVVTVTMVHHTSILWCNGVPFQNFRREGLVKKNNFLFFTLFVFMDFAFFEKSEKIGILYLNHWKRGMVFVYTGKKIRKDPCRD